MKKLLLVRFLLILAFPFVASAQCPTISVKEAFKKADAVFVGKVKYGYAVRDPVLVNVATFKVMRYWKGNIKEEVVVASIFDENPISFEGGKRYLVFAKKNKFKGMSGINFLVDGCMGTHQLGLSISYNDIYTLGPSKIR